LALHYRKQKTFATELFHKFSYITSGAKYYLMVIALNHWDTLNHRWLKTCILGTIFIFLCI